MRSFAKGWRLGRSRERRLVGDRRWCQERRIDDVGVATERRGGDERRSGADRRERD